MAGRLVSILTDAVELHLKSVSALLDLSKGYVKALDGIIRTSGKTDGNAPPGPAEQPRVPLLLVGEAGETVGGAFIINNPSANNLSLTFAVQGELSGDDVKVTPPSLTLGAGAEAVIRIAVKLTAKLEENRDYRGVVAVPGLSNQIADFVARRLPSTQPGKRPSKGSLSE
ncbi:MAG: hypothetical protein QOJ86_2093 [Bradyrhizobium sp.]|jgi:hypothetical protein|nr:hypothetical protein [Bradyrhizobium sp.]